MGPGGCSSGGVGDCGEGELDEVIAALEVLDEVLELDAALTELLVDVPEELAELAAGALIIEALIIGAGEAFAEGTAVSPDDPQLATTAATQNMRSAKAVRLRMCAASLQRVSLS